MKDSVELRVIIRIIIFIKIRPQGSTQIQ